MQAVQSALYALCYRPGLMYARCWKIWIPWIRLPLAVRLRALLAEAAAASAVQRFRGPGPPDSAPPEVSPTQPGSVEQWEPWSAHPPFADEVTRWWPSDEVPPADPPVVTEDMIPDVAPEIIDWTDRGVLLDSWV